MGRQMRIQDTQLTRQEQQYQRQEGLREGLSRAYNPATGQIDQVAGRRAYVEAGDIGGALEFDQHMTALHGAQFTQNRDRLIAGASFLRDVRDEASFQQAIQRARAAGVDLADVPPSYDPQWVQGVVQIGTRLQQAQHYQGPTPFQQDLAAGGIAPNTDDYRRILENRFAPQPRFITGANGETIVVQPPPAPTPTRPPTVPPGTVEVYNGRRYQLNAQGAWSDIGPAEGQPAQEGATPASAGTPDLDVWRGAGSGPRGFP